MKLPSISKGNPLCFFPFPVTYIHTLLYQLYYTTSGALSIIIKNKVVKFINEMFLQHSSIQNISEETCNNEECVKIQSYKRGEKIKED